MLAGIQNILGKVLTIQRVYNQILAWQLEGKYEQVWTQYGRLY